MDWYAYIKKYVWDDNKTPYFVAVPKLSKSQAEHELFSYTFFMGLLFAIISIVSLTDNAVYGKSSLVALYAFTVSTAAVLFGLTKLLYAVAYLAAAPAVALAVLAYVFLVGLAPDLASIDKVVIIVIAVALLRYSLRVMAITRIYPSLRDGSSQV
ncbi:MAG: hypothetical protein MI920_10100 [Kiloniellales bacterium]|nr:hypothetical protein [Kiloniellales bacterium]